MIPLHRATQAGLTVMAVLLAPIAFGFVYDRTMVPPFAGVMIGIAVMIGLNYLTGRYHGVKSLLVAAALSWSLSCPAQTAPASGDYDNTVILPVFSPVPLPPLEVDANGQQIQPKNFILAALCVGGVVAIVGWAGFKMLNKALDIHELVITNNAAQPGPLVQNDFDDYVKNGFTAVPDFDSPGQVSGVTCLPDDGSTTPYPIPVAIDYSNDGTNWVTVVNGAAVGDEFAVPLTGLWRARVIPTQIVAKAGVVTVTAPPGVLEVSQDLVHWQTLQVNWSQTEVTANPGVFYRVRL